MTLKTFIIAEVGSNWTCKRDILDSIQMAKQCGADAVKLQLFTQEELYGFDCGLDRSFELDPEWLPELKEKADAADIEFMITAFSEKGYDLVDPLVKRHKIASSENQCPNFLAKLAGFQKPIIYSCGASSLMELEILLGDKRYSQKLDMTLLYCVVAYPSRSHDLFKMDKLKELADHHGYKIGLSDHSVDIFYTPKSAVYHHGAVVLEKHFKLDRISGTPDAGHALGHSDFKRMVEAIRMDPRAKTIPFRSPEEVDSIAMYNRRLVATKDIGQGEPFKFADNYGFFRVRKPDLDGLRPMNIDGSLCLEKIEKGTPIGPKQVRI